jgi:amino acid adenylation domain-containing protein
MKAEVLQDIDLSPLQKRIWTLQKETASFYSECTVVITGEVNRRQLEESIRHVMTVHDNLRTAYVERPLVAYPMQVVQDEPSFEWIKDEERDTCKPLTASLHQQDAYIHQLRLFMPAMSGDQHTLNAVAKEICRHYASGAAVVQENELQYGQFADWQNELLAEPAEAALDFWQQYNYSNGNSFTAPFAGHQATGGAFTPAFINIPVNFPAGKLSKFTVMACFAVMMKQLTSQQELTIGYVSEGRNYEELENTMGLLSRSLPVISRPREDMTLAALAAMLEEEVDKVSEWQEYFNWGRENDNSRNYFHALFAYNKCTSALYAAPDLNFRLSDIISITDKFDLKLDVLETEDTCRLRFAYNSSKLSRQAGETLARHFAAIINAASAQRTVSEIMRGATVTGFPFPVEINVDCNDSIISLFEATAKRNANAVAVQHSGIALSYKALNEEAGRLATYLQQTYSLKQGDIAAFCLERSEKLLVVMLGILKTGAAYLPVDVRTPAERISYMLEDSGAKVLITDKMLEALSLDELSPVNDEQIDPSSAAYVIYTSGSTGKPKGVMISHASLVNYVSWFISKYSVSASDSTLLFSSVAFDLCYTSLWSSIIAGARVCVHQEAEYLDPVEFTADLIENNITFIKLTPSHFSIVAKDPLFDEKVAAYSLRLIVLGGEPIAADDVERYLRHHPQVQFVNHYGPTETTIGVLTYDINFNNISTFRRRPVIGSPIGNTQAFVLTEDMSAKCVPGETGEICISGNGVAMGYLNRETLSAEKFIPNPFMPGKLMYRTGDLGRWMPDGTIEFLGRKDFQVKIRGHRIETGEVEYTIASFAGVTDAIVQVVPQAETGEPQLFAFIKSPEGITVKALEAYLRERLPHYMIPAQFIVLRSFPLLPNGKINRSELLKEAAKHHKRAAYLAPRNRTEATLADIWSEVLSVEKPGVHDDFFELGGHSLKAAQLVSRIYKSFGKKVQLKEIFDHPTIGQVAVIINKAEAKDYDAIIPLPESERYEVSHAQKRLWILDHFSKDRIPYNSPSYFRITGRLYPALLADSFRQLIERHESLRTTFITIDGLPWQQVSDYANCGFRMEEIDLRAMNNAFPEAEQIALAEANSPFDLTRGPLLRAKLIQTGNDEYVLVCNIHHIISDGWSLRILFEELLTIYDAQVQGKEHVLPALDIQYKDYAAWHNKRVNGEEEAYWLRKLSNYPRLANLPYDENPEGYIRYNVELGVTESDALREIAKKYNTTLSNLVLGIYGLFIHQLSGQDDILIGVGHANRNHADTEKIIGFFINIVIIRMQFSGDDTLQQLVRRLSDDALEAFGHSEYPFDLLVEKLCSNRYADRQPILNVMYDFKNYNDVLLGNDGTRSTALPAIERISFGEHIASHDLILHVTESDSNIIYNFEYKQDCFSTATAQQFYNIFGKLLTLVTREL